MRSTRRHFIKKVVTGVGGLMLACESDPVQPDKTVIVQSIVFGSGDADSLLPVGETAVVTFNGAVGNVKADTIYLEKQDGTAVSGLTITVNSDTKCTLTFPTLTPGTKYRLVIDGVTTADGQAIDGDKDGRSGGQYKVNLTVIPPTSFTNIYNLNENSISNVYINIAASNPLKPETITTDSVKVIDKDTNGEIDLTLAYDSTKREIQLLINQLKYAHYYIIRVTEAVKDTWGFSLDGDNDNVPGGQFEYEFQTAANPDKEPPMVTEKSPIDGTLGVDISTTIFAVFNEALKSSGISDKMYLTDASATRIPGGVNYDVNANTLRFIPEAPLSNSTVYTVHLTGIEDQAGNKLNDGMDYTWSFTTEIEAGLQIPEAVASLTAQTGINPGETVLSWTVPADRTPTGAQASGAELTFDIFRDTEPIVNEGGVIKAELAESDYQPGLNTGSQVQLTMVNPQNARTYYYAIRVKDTDSNVSQITTSQAVVSRGYPMQLRLVDGVLYERNGIATDSQVWSGIKIFQEDRQIGMSDSSGQVQFEAASLTGSLNVGDDNSAVIPVLLPYSLPSGSMAAEFAVRLLDKSSFPISETVSVLNPAIINPDAPTSFAYLLKWSANVTQAGVGEERIVPLKILGLQAENETTTRDMLANVNTWISLASRNQLRVQTFDEATILTRTFDTEEAEITAEENTYNESAMAGLLWTQSQYERGVPFISSTDGNPGNPGGPHQVSKGKVITQGVADGKQVFTEFWRVLMNMPAQLDDQSWDMTVLNDVYDVSAFMDKWEYRGVANTLYLEEIVAAIKTLPVGSKIATSIINYPLQNL